MMIPAIAVAGANAHGRRMSVDDNWRLSVEQQTAGEGNSYRRGSNTEFAGLQVAYKNAFAVPCPVLK